MENKVINGDCIEEMKKLSSKSVDCIITDPPFNASVSKIKWKEKSYESLNEDWDKIENLDKFNEEWINEIQRIMKEGSSLFIYCSHHNLLSVWKALEKTDLRMRNLLTWFRPDNMPMKRAYLGYFAYSSLWILFFTKGKIKTWNYKRMKELNNGIQMRDMFSLKLNSSNKIYHPTQKPLKQIKDFIEISTNEGDLILDCFSGGGTTLIASKELGRRFIGIEKEKKYVDISNERLNETKKQQVLSLFAKGKSNGTDGSKA